MKTTRLLTTTLSTLFFASSLLAPHVATAVEISFFAQVPLDVTSCSGLPICGGIGTTDTGTLSGIIDVPNPLVDGSGSTSQFMVTFSDVATPHWTTSTGEFPIQSLTYDYIAPTSPGAVATVSITSYHAVVGYFSGFLGDGNDFSLRVFSYDGWEYDVGDNSFSAQPSVSAPVSAFTNYVLTVPEPSTLLLLSMAGLGVIVGYPSRSRCRHCN